MDETIKKLEKSITRARNKEMGIVEDEETKEIPSFPLVNVPDHQLTESELKEKRKQKLNKAGYDARMRMKAEKDAAKKREEEAAKADEEHRLSNKASWLEEKRRSHAGILENMRERKKFKAQLGDRKSLVAQQRMKTITNMASEAKAPKKRKKKEGADDTFGADDEDWAVYREIVSSYVDVARRVQLTPASSPGRRGFRGRGGRASDSAEDRSNTARA